MLAHTFHSLGGDLFDSDDQSPDSPNHLNLKFAARLTEILAGWSLASDQNKGRNMIMCQELRKGVEAIMSASNSNSQDMELGTSDDAPHA